MRMANVEQHFLGFEQTPLEAAASHIVERYGSDLSGLIIALPGGRAMRRLQDLLGEAAGRDWTPPTMLTQGQVVDRLLPVQRTTASRLVRTLAWEKALRGLPKKHITALAPNAGNDADLSYFAPQLRTLHQEFVSAGIEFQAVLEPGVLNADSDREGQRWEALVHAQGLYRAALAEAAVDDPHDARRAALNAGDVVRDVRLVLVGVVDPTKLLRETLDVLDGEVLALVPADKSWTDAFDSIGALLPDAVMQRPLEISEGAWRVVDGPADQSREVVRILAGWQKEHDADGISIGVADREVAPHLAGLLESNGVLTRDPGAHTIGESSPVRLMRDLAQFLDKRGFVDLATLWRHPDLEAQLGLDAATSPASELDAYYDRHLPHRVADTWIGANATHPRDPGPRVDAAWKAMTQCLGKLVTESGTRPLNAWIPAFHQALTNLYASRDFNLDVEVDRQIDIALKALIAALDDLEDIPRSLDPISSASQAIAIWIDTVASDPIPPAGGLEGQATIEMLGWLEVPLDDAPAVIITGVQEGSLPASETADAFLPDGLRRQLNLACDHDRCARDRFGLDVALRTRAPGDAVLITGRQNAKGDPLRPSRLLFQAEANEVVNRVRSWIDESGQPGATAAKPQDVAPVPHVDQDKETWSVTSFSDYMTSPYVFHLRHVLGLRTVDDDTQELDARSFGSLAHDVLDAMAKEGPHDATDPEVLADWLVARLAKLVVSRYGKLAMPAVALQQRQLEWRLRRFAPWQVQRHADGWRILASEWAPDGGSVEFPVDGNPIQLRGRIDRIDRHLNGYWAILDYKTTAEPKTAGSAYKVKTGEWKDLQLPMYAWLTQELIETNDLRDAPQLGYINLPKSATSSPLSLPRKLWEGDEISEGWGLARQIVRDVRAGHTRDLGKPPGFLDPMMADLVERARLCGVEAQA
jgi:ATP-dependent helicase/nuclease subunit B